MISSGVSLPPALTPAPARSGPQDRQNASAQASAPSTGETASGAESSDVSRSNAGTLDKSELKELQSLKARDREVRAHEAAHQSAGGQYAGAASFTYERGPDGAQYAVGGEVPITISPVKGDPAATINKMRTVQSAALAPAQPSGQDRSVAAKAMQLMLQAQAELALQSRTTGDNAGGDGNGSSAATVRQARDGQAQYRTVSRLEAGSPAERAEAPGSAGDFRAIA